MNDFEFDGLGDEHVLPFCSQQAFDSSKRYADKYLLEHVSGNAGFDNERTGVIASARLEWILAEGRAEISGKFSEEKIRDLLTCFQGEIFSPEQFDRIASSLCDDRGIELDEYEETPLAPFIDELRALSPVQRIALADALEQTWHRGLPSEKTVAEFLSELGIELTPN